MGFPGLPTDHVWNFLGAWGWANVDWCEATMMGYVTEPANTWSNLVYIFAGLFLFRRDKGTHRLVQLMPWALMMLGLLSGFYHATNAWITQLGDFVGMFMVASIPLLINLEKGGLKKAGSFSTYFLVITLSTIMTIVGHLAHLPIQGMIGLFFGMVLVSEMILMKTSPLKSYKHLFLTLASFAVAISFSALDVSRTMCDPHNHIIQGHALWHCFSALGVFFADSYARESSSRSEKPGILSSGH
jgi:hypothetical protein